MLVGLVDGKIIVSIKDPSQARRQSTFISCVVCGVEGKVVQ